MADKTKTKTKNQKLTYQMPKVIFSTYQLLDQGLTGSYFVKFPDGNETRWIPDLCAELNRIYNQLKIEEAENEKLGNTVREAFKSRDADRIELEKLRADHDALGNDIDAVCVERDEARYQRDLYREKVDCLEIQISEFEKALREQNSEELICAKLNVDEMRKQRDEARALLGEASRQRDGWRDETNRLKNIVELMSNTRPELSRLEIAARIIQGWAANPNATTWKNKRALEIADALIAANEQEQQND